METDDISTVEQGIDIIEKNYVSPVLNYLKNKNFGHGYNNMGYAKCY